MVLGSRAGTEIVHPMAVVMLGGLATVALLGLFLMPVLYAQFGTGGRPEPGAELDLLQRWAGVPPQAAGAGNGSPAPVPAEPEPGHVGAGVDREEGT